MAFHNLLDTIKENRSLTIRINDKARSTVFVASYGTRRYPQDYFMVFFSDGAVLEILPDIERVCFSEVGKQRANRDLTTNLGHCLNIRGKEYVLHNFDDQQFLRKVYFGHIQDGEGECEFSDYCYAHDTWRIMTFPNGEKSDIFFEEISLDSIFIE